MTIDEAYDEWRAGKSDVPWSRDAFAAGAAWQAVQYGRLVREADKAIWCFFRPCETGGLGIAMDDLREALAEAKGEQ